MTAAVELVDRRGRGLSGDAQDHDLSTEVADLDAVPSVAGPGARLFGHSYGAIVAAASAAAGADRSALTPYEPPLPVSGADPGQIAATSSVTAAVAAGDHDGALSMMLTRRGARRRPTSQTCAGRRSEPGWSRPSRRCHASRTSATARSTTSIGSPRSRSPPLLLIGTATASEIVDATRFLTEKLPTTTVVEIPGQGHFAHVAVPDTVADAVRSFLGEA
ncbi:alpha/beta fold hydrolase [Pseudonocardia sp. CA-142604]|uniref:alpha/beta fold hydrolase n=1 Tax=Pseudonocardia sp. CA-142604 TaxID=3240024 RepID=UPI003D8E23CD